MTQKRTNEPNVSPTTDDDTESTDPKARREDLRRRQADLGRAHVLDAAAEVFARNGYTNATIREIAHAAGFSPATVYGFVDSKEALLAAIMDRHGAALIALHEAVLERLTDPEEQLHAIVDLQVDYHLAHPDFARLFQHTTGLSFLAIEATMDDESRRRLHRALELVEDVVRRGIDALEFAPGNPATLAVLFSAVMEGYLFRVLFQVPETPADRVALHEFMTRAFSTPG